MLEILAPAGSMEALRAARAIATMLTEAGMKVTMESALLKD